ncbi:NAD(P)/FAD-dependent oxidoreductase [Natribacillus halophilus]|uniref:Glycine/D-amino acid oxidase n=1 Tax=Natribacillus halophilus TaxID=549003 RepID=A0A1G8R9I2_9BACI|nr:FAD-binding oxidoreductase [Natribacillus halophilus]SDJ13637.1 Glycine/D-amino acid oxidase [Natribacillus halophilus]
MVHKADIIIIGGGVIASSIAYNLLNDGYEEEILIFEKDRTYEFSSTPRSVGGIRQLFTTDINIQISQFSHQVYKNFADTMAANDEKAEIDFKQRGYLLLGTEANIPYLNEHLKVQHKHGVPSELLNKEDLLNIIPELNTDDLAGGLFCAEDGYLDPYSVMQGYIKQSKKMGAKYIYEEVDTILTDHNEVTGVRLNNGQEYKANVVINCAGPWSGYLSEKIGLPLPIVPLRRQVFQFDSEKPLKKGLPLTVDPTGVYFRHEGNQLLSGFAEDTKPGIDFRWKRSYFIDQLWPVLGNRVENFEKVKVTSGWSGLYTHNTKDQNAIVGKHPQLDGYYLACGFSGHGMQQAPAVGKGLAELISKGVYETIDLRPLRFERFKENDLVIEKAII